MSPKIDFSALSDLTPRRSPRLAALADANTPTRKECTFGTPRQSPRLAALADANTSTRKECTFGKRKLAAEPLDEIVNGSKKMKLDSVPDSTIVTQKVTKSSFPKFSAQFARTGANAYVQIDVKQTIKANKDLYAAARSGVLLPKQRSGMIAMLLKEMFKHINSWYPCKQAKLQLAKDIVQTFPKLASAIGDPWSAFFNGDEGHIQQEFRSLRKGAKIRMRSCSSKKDSNEQSCSDTMSRASDGVSLPEPSCSNAAFDISMDDKIQITNLATLPDKADNLNRILKEMAKFYGLRQNLLKSKSVEHVLKEFPKLLAYEGALINAEFRMWWQKDDQFLGTFKVVFRPAILEYVKRFVPKVDRQLQSLTNDDLKALLALVAITPRLPAQTSSFQDNSNKSKAKGGKKRGAIDILKPNMKVDHKVIPHPALLQRIQNNVNVQTYDTSFYRLSSDGKTKVIQPFIIETNDDQGNKRYYLRANGETMPLGSCPLNGFSILFKYLHVFQLTYDIDLLHFYTVIEVIFGMESKVPASISAFITNLRNISKELNG